MENRPGQCSNQISCNVSFTEALLLTRSLPDRGILITDYVDLADMDATSGRKIESLGHQERMELAYTRYCG